MPDDIDIGYDIDPSGYLAGVNQIDQANQQLQRSLGNVVVSTTALQRAMSVITPSRATTAGMALLAQQAALTEQKLSTLQAVTTTTGASFDRLSGGIKQLARDMPLGFDSSRQLVETFAKMGVGAAGSEAKITALATSVSKLSGATGDSVGALASGMSELAKATGNSQLDPRRFAALGDSLTTVAAQSGASASAILQFSKSIAPMAQASGIGATQILGISSAFAKLGDDGIGASTAINKMLTDMSRSVREGTPELKTYAMIVGQTSSQFEKLFKANPAEALTQVTEAIAKAGTDGPRMLERIGIDGVRGQRAIQGLVASGGLRTGITEAVSAYGSGSTEKAAAAAFGGLSDSLTELREAAKQVADAFGAPLLQPLTAFTTALKVPTAMLGQIVGSGPAQAALSVGGYAVGGLLAARTVMGPLGVAALGRQAATSGPLRALFGGLASGRGEDPSSFSSRYGSVMAQANDEGRLGPINQRLFDFGQGLGQNFPAQPRSGPGLLSRMRRGVVGYGSNIAQTYMASVRQQFENAAMSDPTQRLDSMGRAVISPDFQRAGTMADRAFADARANGASQFGAARASMSAFNAEVSKATGNTAKLSSGFLSMARAQASFVGQLGKDAAKGTGSMLGKVGNFLGPGALVAGGLGLLGYAQQNAQAQRDANDNLKNQDISGSINSYRESIGKAVESTKTFGSLTENLSMALASAAKVKGFDETKSITPEDIAAAQGSASKVTRRYIGSSSDVAAQIQSFAPGGISPDELQAIKVDLLRQRSSSDVADILKQLPSSMAADQRGTSNTPVNLNDQFVKTALAATKEGRNVWGNIAMLGSGMEVLDNQNGFIRSPFAPGGALYASPLSGDSMNALDSVREGVAQQYRSQSTKFGANYASQERMKSMNKVLEEVYKAGNVEAFYELSKRFASDLGADPNNVYSAHEFAANGYDFGKVIAGGDPNFKKRYDELVGSGAKTTGSGGLTPELQRSIYYDTILPESSFISGAFDSRSQSPMAQAMAASLAAPGDVGKQTDAINAIITGAQVAGKSMIDLSVEATKAANAVDEGSAEWMRLQRLASQAQVQMRHDNADLSTGQQQMQEYSYWSQIAAIRPTTDAQQQQVDQAKSNVQALQDQMRQRLQARLQVQRQYEVQVARSTEDFNRSQRYAQEDYQIQVSRSERAFRLQQEQTAHAYNLGVKRTEQDFYISRARGIRDFNISAGRAEEDYQRTRMRQFRDFNKQLKRMIEDAARDMMDPYSRIQAKPTWDAQNLIVNLREQAEFMERQKQQLDKLRKMGLSSSAIDQLGLGKAENAQQVNNLISDVANDPAVISQLNKIADQRASAASGLFTDASNKELERQKADFQQQLKDQETDYKTSLRRSRADLAKSMADAQADMKKAMARGAEDYRYNLAISAKQFRIALGDMAADAARARTRAKEQLDTSLSRMADDIRMADQNINGSMTDLATQVNRAIHGKAVQWQKILKSDTQQWVTDMQKNVIPKLNSVFSAFGVTPTPSGFVPHLSGANLKLQAQERASGGPIEGYSPHPKADNIPVWATGGEFMHNVAAVKYYGLDTMHALNARRIPKEALIGAQRFADGGWINPVAPVRPGFPWGHYPSGRVHKALDYPVPIGTPVYSPWTGPIIEADWSNSGFGNHIRMLNQTGIGTILGHLSRLLVRKGMSVAQHQLLGFSGSTGNSTGPHLHLEMRRSLYDPATAFDFTKLSGGGAGIAGAVASMMKPMALAALFAGMKSKPGPYDQLTHSAMQVAKDTLYDQGGELQPGRTSVMNATGKPEKVLTESQWAGISSLAKVAGQIITTDDLRGLNAAGGIHIVVHNSGSVTYDQRNDFSGAEITVMSSDPDDMARKLEKRQTSQRINQTRGVRRGS